MKKKLNLNSLIEFGIVSFVWLIHSLLSLIFGIQTLNKGISFGWFGGWLVVLLQGIVIVGLTYFYKKTKEKFLLWILVGGVANLLDRMIWGGVRDYWKIPFINLFNNVNDWLIFVGLIGIIKKMLWKK